VFNPVPFADKVREHFERVHDEVFTGDPAANPSLDVEVLGISVAHDTPVLVLVAPWTLCGLAEPPDGRLTSTLRVRSRPYPALLNEVDSIGSYWSIVFIPDVSTYLGHDQARAAALEFAEPFRTAVAKVRLELTQVEDETRRALLKGKSAKASSPARTPFGKPDAAADPSQGA
jgi:hypothetical protein